MILHRRNYLVILLNCCVLSWSAMAVGQAPTSAAPALDSAAAAAVSNSAALPPPAPVPPTTVQALGASATALPPLPAQPSYATAAPAAPAAAAVAPAVTLPGAPAPALNGTVNTLPSLALPAAPPAAAVPVSNVPPVIIPTAPAALPNVIEPANEISKTNSPPLVSTASGGPLLPTLPNAEILASRRLPLPALTPESPLIPGPSLAETANQKRQLTTLPGSGGDTNYAYATIGGPGGPARPLITPPSIVDPVEGTDIGKNYPPLQAVMPQAAATPFHLDSPSAFGTPSPPSSLTFYMSKTMRRTPDKLQLNPSPTNAEIIVLRGGQEFQGLVHDRGEIWQVELLNGTIVEIPGPKVASVRKLLPEPTSTPSARSVVFPPQALYKERQTD